jgi:hypothetical protein
VIVRYAQPSAPETVLLQERPSKTAKLEHNRRKNSAREFKFVTLIRVYCWDMRHIQQRAQPAA